MSTKYITNRTMVDLSRSRRVRDWGKGDACVELWADEGNQHVWLETNGDPVADWTGVVDLLEQCGVPTKVAERAASGDLSDFE